MRRYLLMLVAALSLFVLCGGCGNMPEEIPLEELPEGPLYPPSE